MRKIVQIKLFLRQSSYFNENWKWYKISAILWQRWQWELEKKTWKRQIIRL